MGSEQPLHILEIGKRHISWNPRKKEENAFATDEVVFHEPLTIEQLIKSDINKIDIIIGNAVDLADSRIIELKHVFDFLVWGILDTNNPHFLTSINSLGIDEFIAGVSSINDFHVRLLRARKVLLERKHRERLKQDLQKQNLELTAMAERLEDLVSERTKDMERSRHELEEQTQREQNLVRFVSELSRWHDVDEILSYLRSEMRIFHELADPILFWVTPSGHKEIVFWQGLQLQRKVVYAGPSSVLRLRVHDRGDQVFLATQLGRPVGRTVSLPLALGPRQAVAFFEHALSEAKLEKFLQTLEERIQVLQITWERVFGEREALQTSLQWERAFDTLADPIAIIDQQFHVLRGNRQFTANSGKKCYERWAGRKDVCPGCPIYDKRKDKSQPTMIQNSDRLWYVYSYSVQDRDKSKTYVNHYVDVTETKKLFERTVQSEKMAAVGLLANHIAHELNNPLTGIRSLAQILKTHTLPTQTASDIAEVETAAGRCQKIIENFLAFSKGSSVPETMDLNDLVERTLPLLKTAFRDHRTEFDFADQVLLITVESSLLQQVIFNLVHNACQSMPDRGVLKLSTGKQNGFVFLSVHDTGVGMSLETQKRIFEPFFTTKTEGLGTGLGLSLCRSVVEKFSGRIEVSSKIGEGSTFSVLLPEAATLSATRNPKGAA